MNKLQEFLTAIQYKITDGAAFQWHCYGPFAHNISTWNDSNIEGGYNAAVIFNTENQTVYEVQVSDFSTNRSYRWIDPTYLEEFKNEAEQRDVEYQQDYDDVNFVDLEVFEDAIEKITAIVNGTEYDSRVQIPIDLPEQELFVLMKFAHEQDITLNQLIEQSLVEYINRNPV